MRTLRQLSGTLLSAASIAVLLQASLAADNPSPVEPKQPQKSAEETTAEQQPAPSPAPSSVIAGKLLVTTGMSITIDSPLNIRYGKHWC